MYYFTLKKSLDNQSDMWENCLLVVYLYIYHGMGGLRGTTKWSNKFQYLNFRNKHERTT